MMRFVLIIGFILLLQRVCSAQYAEEGRVVVIQDRLVDSVLYYYETLRLEINQNPESKAIPGYRIQIFFDSGLNSSDRARQARDAFLFLYPEEQAYVSWKAPNYRVRVGDFKTRLEAERMLQKIIINYPNAWVTKDEINFPETN
jgi:hypothetical protein